MIENAAPVPPPAPADALIARITDYLSTGGLFNPELAQHDAVRDLLIDCRDRIAALTAENERLQASEMKMAMLQSESYQRATKAERELEQARRETTRQRDRANHSDDQLCWLATWCQRKFGIDTNQVIGSEGWPRVLVEVVAQAAEARADELAKDAERLDAVERMGATVHTERHQGGEIAAWVVTDTRMPKRRAHYGDTFRAAIDAALAKEGK